MLRLPTVVLFCLTCAGSAFSAFAQTPAPAVTPAKPPAPKAPAATTPARPAVAVPPLVTDEEKTIYALGLVMQRSLAEFDLSTRELDILKRALTDGSRARPVVELDEWGPKIGPLARARVARVAMREKAAGEAYLTKAATEPNARKTTSGLVYRQITPGTGASPSASDLVRVHYRGTLINGTEFDSSYTRNEPTQFSLGGVIRCWSEGVQMMNVGGKARLVCPSSLAYGDEGSAPIPAGATLIFEIELLEIVK